MATFKKTGKKGQEKWSVVFDLPGHSPRKQKKLSGFKTKNEANLSHISFIANYTPPKNKKPTSDDLLFEHAFEIYFNQISESLKESSLLNAKDNYRNHILPLFKGDYIQHIEHERVDSAITTIKQKKLSTNTKKKILGLMKRFFHHCVESYNCEQVFPKTVMLKNTEQRKEMLIWGESEFRSFIASVDDIVYNTFFTFMYLTGCRRGEALALTWNDLSENTIRINKSLTYHTKCENYKITTTKNVFSNRNVIIPDTLKCALEKLKNFYASFEMFSESNYIFGNLKPLPAQSITNNLIRGCKKSEVKLIRLHDLRHSHASFLISKNHDIVTIARRLGHSDIEMTLNRYAHIMPNKQTELMSTLEEIF